jgi:nicotinate-nucleotide adenylyltransferase
MKIGIFGGSFNPIHIGHVTLAKTLREKAALDEVWLMVSPLNPLKQGNTDLLSDQLRYQLARIALHGEPGIKACNYELHLPKPSYTWNTLQHLRQDFPDHTFILLIGGDNWQNFHRWYRAADIMREHEIVVYPRRGSGMEDTHHNAGEGLDRQGACGNIRIVDTALIDVSSTDIRLRVQRGEPITHLVPAPIEKLVRRLY